MLKKLLVISVNKNLFTCLFVFALITLKLQDLIVHVFIKEVCVNFTSFLKKRIKNIYLRSRLKAPMETYIVLFREVKATVHGGNHGRFHGRYDLLKMLPPVLKNQGHGNANTGQLGFKSEATAVIYISCKNHIFRGSEIL